MTRRLSFAVCLLAIFAARLFADEALSLPVTLPIKLSHNRVILPGKINDLPLNFLIDSGCSIPTVHPDIIDQLKLTSSGSVRINGIAGEERAPTYRGVVVDLGPVDYRPRSVASVPSEREQSRRRRDGVLGYGFFRRFTVEFDTRAQTIKLHSPTNFTYTGRGEIIPFRIRDEIPVVEASIILPDKEPIKSEYEVDTGCDSGLCLGAKFVDQNKLLETIEHRSSEKFGIGGSVETKSGTIPILRLGKLDVQKPQTDFFREGSPVDEPMAGHIGMGLLHRYKVILDYQRKQLILEPFE